MQQISTRTTSLSVTRLNPLALAFGFGVAGVVEILLFGAVMGAMSGMMGGNGGGWMHGSGSGGMMGGGWMMGGPGYGGGSTIGGGIGFFVYALIWGFVGSAVAGGIAALVYNAVIARDA